MNDAALKSNRGRATRPNFQRQIVKTLCRTHSNEHQYKLGAPCEQCSFAKLCYVKMLNISLLVYRIGPGLTWRWLQVARQSCSHCRKSLRCRNFLTSLLKKVCQREQGVCQLIRIWRDFFCIPSNTVYQFSSTFFPRPAKGLPDTPATVFLPS